MRCRSWPLSDITIPPPGPSLRNGSISCDSSMSWRRRPFAGRAIEPALNISDLREVARNKVPGFIFEYMEGGAEDEATLRANRTSLESLRFLPRTLVDTANRHQ